MKELSLHILDVAQNSVSAGAKALDLTVAEKGGRLAVVIADNGRGMSPEFLATVTDPFTTTRTTRKVGLGLPLLKLAAEQTGGGLTIESTVGVGTTVNAAFDAESIDCPPLGDMAATVALLVQGAPEDMELTYTRETEKGVFRFDTREIREILGPVPLSEPEVAQWMKEYIAEGEESVI
ncbi:MAG: ATP-binding protein [Clostridia bacterium]|nr:ATP-binding protein [Clostridia bacterium]